MKKDRRVFIGGLAAFAAMALGGLQAGQELKLNLTYSDHMLFQRGEPIVFAGTAAAGERVEVKMNGASASATADAKGFWRVALPAMAAGGPYEATVCGAKGCRRLRDVLVGELWLASGQSNMEMPVCGGKWYSLTNGPAVAAAANDPQLRFRQVGRQTATSPRDGSTGPGGVWFRGDDTNAVRGVSATAYFFAKDLQRRLKVPVGVVVAAWGGSRIETWMPECILERHNLKKLIRDLEASRRPPKKETAEEKRRRLLGELADWIAAVERSNAAVSTDAKANWMKPGLDERGWTPGLVSIDTPAFVWMRWHVTIPENAGEVFFDAAAVSDTDEAWFDGKPIGKTGIDVPFHWGAKRHYAIGKVAAGEHVLALRVENHSASGGPVSPRLVWNGGEIDLSRSPLVRRVEAAPSVATGPRPCCPWDFYGDQVPGPAFNAMIAPFRDFRFRGTIWYQGCANADEYSLYEFYQPALVDGLRETFGRPDMAFVCVQLAGYVLHNPEHRMADAEVAAMPPSEQGYVMMRDVQAKIAALPNCACATAFDIGDHSDIHPKAKREVGRRLAGLAERLCYGGREKAEGPQVVKAERRGAAVEVTFDGPIDFRNGPAAARTFALADEFGRLSWAKARLVSPTVVRVESEQVKNPTFVDYGRAPFVFSGSVYSRDGYPLLPFRRPL